MLKKSGILVLLSVFLFLAVNVQAVTFSPNVSEIATFTNQGVVGGTLNQPASIVENTPFDQSVKFTGTFNLNDLSAYTNIKFGVAGSFDFSGYQKYELSIFNGNENTWNFSLYADSQASSNYSIAAGAQSVLSLDVSTLNNVSEYGFILGANLPLGVSGDSSYPDTTFEAKVAPVPEPATLLLLGSGLVGLAFLKRRKA